MKTSMFDKMVSSVGALTVYILIYLSFIVSNYSYSYNFIKNKLFKLFVIQLQYATVCLTTAICYCLSYNCNMLLFVIQLQYATVW